MLLRTFVGNEENMTKIWFIFEKETEESLGDIVLPTKEQFDGMTYDDLVDFFQDIEDNFVPTFCAGEVDE